MGNEDFIGVGIHAATLDKTDYEPAENPMGYGSLWRSYRSDSGQTVGSIHLCAPTRDWSITVRDFTPIEDVLLEFDQPDHLSISWYESVSGEEFTPYRKLRAKSVWGIFSGAGGWRGLVHEGVPVRSISIEMSPEASRAFLDREYPGEFKNLRDAFSSLSDDGEFPEMRNLLRRLWPRPDSSDYDAAHYEKQVFDALRLIVNRTRALPPRETRAVTAEDRERIFGISAYIDDHYTRILKVPDLARVAGMSPTKFKECFKAVTGCTLTQYIQRRRISQAEQMLHQPSLSIELISHAVGYTCVSRFSELFRRETGLLPSEYRRGL
ncbi:helix-turn-helix domain-containing protein [Olsenella uli]|uniref:helix-turn-helix domain-containing protein n=1 Tax=Olsenella uli TaxID=133926 RepID=UPI0012AB93B5|nr:AraC family transcriptional regulator [Olsenella uli]